ncbi:MAG: acyl-CoA dehydrogenase family protein [Steroidobacteraceae bacterium]|jgi:alkylation response protein AidB-like acyl-CoA dehydrogenase|nr:acyl-CoA dehydrogenase family protein [Steroidobacteraceae bacterium]
MDFRIDAEVEQLVGRIRAFVDERLVPLEPRLLEQGIGPLLPEIRALRSEVRKLGLWAPNFPREYGGLGLDLVAHGLVSEALGRCPLGHYVFGCNAPDAGNVELLHLYGSEAQKATWLAPLARGEIRSCFGMTERENSGANPLMLEARAELEGDQWVLNGRKWFTTGADGASLCIAMVITDPEAPPHQRASMILVPASTPGYRLERNTPIMGHAGQDLFSHGEIAFEDCRVPAGNLLGPRGEGFRLAQARLGPGRIHHCMRWLGICQRALELLIDRASSRQVSPEGRTLAHSDIIRAWIAESAAEMQAARLMVLHTAWRIEHAGARAARDDVSMIKFFVAKVLERVVDRALQVHGGLGMTDYTVLAWYYREERAARIYDGPDEVHKLSVARRLIGARGR